MWEVPAWSSLVTERKLFHVMPWIPVFSTSAATGIAQVNPGDCTTSTGTQSCLPLLAPSDLHSILAVVARVIAEQCLCLTTCSSDENYRSCLVFKLSFTFPRNTNHLVSCSADVKSVIYSKYPARRRLLVLTILYEMVS